MIDSNRIDSVSVGKLPVMKGRVFCFNKVHYVNIAWVAMVSVLLVS